jgi:DNA adenine methylase
MKKNDKQDKEDKEDKQDKQDKIIIKNISPLRYPGGKTRACEKLHNIMKEYFNINDYNNILSPFFGGGSYEFYLQNKYNVKLIVNDKFTPLYNFWNQIKINKEKLCNELRNKKTVSKEDFINYRQSIIKINNEPLQQAFQYFIINRCSFSGATLSGGFSQQSSIKRYTKTSIDKIENLNLIDFSIENLDFSQFLNNYNEITKTIIFLDPPYYLENKSKLYGNKGDLHENFDHYKLYDLLKYKKNWMMTYNDCEYIRNLYSKFIIIDIDWKYGMNKSKKSSEIVIISK